MYVSDQLIEFIEFLLIGVVIAIFYCVSYSRCFILPYNKYNFGI